MPLSGAKSSGRRLRLSEMQAEVGTAVVAVALAPSRRAAEQFVHAGESDLRAEDGDAPVQRFNLGSLSHLLRSAAVPDVCADARAWRSSRFRHVSPFTARLGVWFKSQSAKFAAAVRDPGIESSSFTDAAERALYQKIDHLSEPRRRGRGRRRGEDRRSTRPGEPRRSRIGGRPPRDAKGIGGSAASDRSGPPITLSRMQRCMTRSK